jgi:hypothetical protein
MITNVAAWSGEDDHGRPASPYGGCVIFSLVYVSRAAAWVTRQDLLELMETSRAANARTGITGLLLYSDGGFLQLLEGPRGAVESLYASIRVDERHDDVTLARTREQREREFPDWSMAFGAVDAKPLTIATGTAAASPTDVEAAFVRELLDVFDGDGTTGPPPPGRPQT